MKRLFFIIMGAACFLTAQAQFTLDECQTLARDNYPLIKQHGLIEQTTDYSIANAMKTYLPQVSFSAQITYQSDVASFPEQMTKMYEQIGLHMKGLNKDQYRAALEVNQTIWDGGLTLARVESIKAESKVSAQSVETELYNVRERINRLYFGILILNEQLQQNKILQDLLQSNYRTVDAYVKNGIALPGDLHAIKAEQLTVSQQYLQIESVAIAYRNMLSVMIGRTIDESATFKKPELTFFSEIPVYQLDNRPEWHLFDAQTKLFEAQKQSVIASTMPRFGLFAQGFYGNPGLNLFKDMTEGKWTWNYIAGIRLQWNFGNFYTKKGDLQRLTLARQQVDNRREVFQFNNGLQQIQQYHAIDKMRKMMIDDDEIIRLRTAIRLSSEAKYANGTITVNDLLKDITVESQALLAKALHELDRLMNIYELQYSVNN
jgi:outer membrane protein TolC